MLITLATLHLLYGMVYLLSIAKYIYGACVID